MERKVSEMSLGELVTERTKLKRSIKKMKRNSALYGAQLKTDQIRNLLLKDEICRRKDRAKISIEKQPAMQLAA